MPHPGELGTHREALGESDAGVCAEPAEGCPCEEGEGPIDCYEDPVRMPGGTLLCRHGQRYCRDGVWTACEDLESFFLAGAGERLVTGPTECNPCDPSCAIHVDRPTSGDLTPDNSDDVEYDPGAGGLVLDSGGSSMPTLPDSDGDGVPDVADDYPRDPTRWHSSGSGIFHLLPYGGPSEFDPLSFTTRVTTADVYFLMDTTGSMGGEINNLKRSLTSGTFVSDPTCPYRSQGIIGAIKCIIPNAWVGVGRFDDYPVSPYGSSGWWGWPSDRVYEHLQDLSPSVAAARAAVSRLYAWGGADWPESQTQALWAVATGGGLGRFLAPRSGCPAGRWGYPCWRDGTIPIVIMFTDAPFHNGPSGYNYDVSRFGARCTRWGAPYCCGRVRYCCRRGWWGRCVRWCTRCRWCRRCLAWSGFAPITWPQSRSALVSRNIRTIVVESGGGWSAAAYRDSVALCRATGSVDAAGRPYVFRISPSGTGLSSAVVDAVNKLANNTRFDVSARAVDNPSTAIDERGFVKSIRVTGWGPGNCRGVTGSTAVQCTPGTQVHFQVEFRNDFVMPTAVPQVFDFEIQVLLDGSVQQRIPVRIVVPPERPMYPPVGYYERVYDATAFCTIPLQRPRWDRLDWTASTPADTSIALEVYTGNTLTEVTSGAPAFTIDIPPNPDMGSLVTVGSELRRLGLPDTLPYLRVRAVLRASSDRSQSPVLTGFNLRYHCVSGE